MLLNCLCVGIGGAIGSVRRYLLGLLPVRPAGGFPLITLGINVLGAFCIGLLMALAGRHTGWDPRLLLLLKVGVCGGFTTFSTFCSESVRLLQNGRPGLAALYVVLSVLLGGAAVLAGQALVKWPPPVFGKHPIVPRHAPSDYGPSDSTALPGTL